MGLHLRSHTEDRLLHTKLMKQNLAGCLPGTADASSAASADRCRRYRALSSKLSLSLVMACVKQWRSHRYVHYQLTFPEVFTNVVSTPQPGFHHRKRFNMQTDTKVLDFEGYILRVMVFMTLRGDHGDPMVSKGSLICRRALFPACRGQCRVTLVYDSNNLDEVVRLPHLSWVNSFHGAKEAVLECVRFWYASLRQRWLRYFKTLSSLRFRAPALQVQTLARIVQQRTQAEIETNAA